MIMLVISMDISKKHKSRASSVRNRAIIIIVKGTNTKIS